MWLLVRSKITVWKRSLFQKELGIEVLGICLSYVKRYFQEHQSSAFLYTAQITQILLLSRIQLLERSKIIVLKRNLFTQKSCCLSFRYAPILWKKVFWRAQVKCFSLYGLNWSDSVLYGNMAFGDIRDYSLITTLFQYKNLWKFRDCIYLM